MEVVNLKSTTPFITKDGSQIREILAHRNSSIRNQSLAEAVIHPGRWTAAHFHRVTEEIYFILEGSGLMRLADEERPVFVGDAIAIPPGQIHSILCTSSEPLRLLCCCAPGYEHDDTVLV